jgi:hypothetical protein
MFGRLHSRVEKSDSVRLATRKSGRHRLRQITLYSSTFLNTGTLKILGNNNFSSFGDSAVFNNSGSPTQPPPPILA